MSVMTHEKYLGNEYWKEKGSFVTIFSQIVPLKEGRKPELRKILHKTIHGVESDKDLKFLRSIFTSLKAEVKVKEGIATKHEIKKYIRDLSEKTGKFDIFIFVFLTYLSYENKDGVVIGDGSIHLGEELCHMNEIYDEVKRVEGMQMKPKIFLIQADNVSLLQTKYSKKGGAAGQKIIKPMKIPQDADRLVIMSDIPQRLAKEEQPSFMIEAFGEALLKNIKRQPEKRQDLLTLTTVINSKVSERIEELKKNGVQRTEDMFVPLVTSTLTKLVFF